MLEERQGGTPTAQTVWSPQTAANSLVERDDHDPATAGTALNRWLYVQQDANGNVTSLTDATGAAVERYAYDPYGAVKVLNPDGSVRGGGTAASSLYGMAYLFQGGRLDAATGLYRFGVRDYGPSLGRWYEPDPAGYVNGPDTYQFVDSNPVGRVDPTGLSQVGSAGMEYGTSVSPVDLAGLGNGPNGMWRPPAAPGGNFSLLPQPGDGGGDGTPASQSGPTATTTSPGYDANGNRVAAMATPSALAGIAIPRDEALEEAIAENERDLPGALVDSGPSTGDIVQAGVGLVTIAVAPEAGMAIEGTAAAIDGVGSLLAVEGTSDATAIAATGELGADAAAAENITTPYGPAIQSLSPEAASALEQVENGATVYKGGVLGRSETAGSQFLSLENPLNPGYVGRYGIPPQNANFNFILSGTVEPGAPVITRIAPGIPPNPGGGIEAVIDPGSFRLDSFYMP